MQKWLVTGAHGFLGANAGVYLASKVQALGLCRPVSQPTGTFPSLVPVALEDEQQIHRAIRDVRPTHVLHCAALSGHRQCQEDSALAEKINVVATRELARAAQDCGSTFIYVSTDAVFDGSTGVYTEGSQPNPFSVYGQTKLEGEVAALAETDALVVRTNFFGWSPKGTSSILEFFYNALRAGEKVKGFTDFHVTTMYVDQLMDAIWRLVELKTTGIVHVASRDALSKYEFAVELADVFGFDQRLITPTSESEEPREWVKGRDISLDTSLLEGITGLPAPSQREGLEQAMARRVSVDLAFGREESDRAAEFSPAARAAGEN